MDNIDMSSYEGQRVKGDQTPDIFLVLEGVCRHIPNPTTYTNLFNDPWEVTYLEQAVVDSMPKARGLPDGSYLLKANQTDRPNVYFIDWTNTSPDSDSSNQCKRWITSPNVFEKYGF